MRIGLVGYQGSGKTTVFRALTSLAGAGPAKPGEIEIGVVKVPDPRVDRLCEVFRPKKRTPASVEFLDLPPLGATGKGAAERVAQMRKVDALACVVDAFTAGKESAWKGELGKIREELAFEDLAVLEKRIDTLKKSVLKSTPTQEKDKKELAQLEKMKPAFEAGAVVDVSALKPDEAKQMRGYQFFLMKPALAVVNVAEGAATGDVAAGDLPAGYLGGSRVCGKVEQEIAELPEADRGAFLKDLGIAEPASNRLIRAAYTALGLMNFFTVGEDEVRAWTVPVGSNAVEAAGAIHSDLARGFIRAEVFSYADWEAAGGDEKQIKAKGRLRLEGKEYRVADGDILNIRFSV